MKLFFRKIFFCQSDGSSGKKEDTDQVRDCHQTIEGICDILISKMGMLFLPAGVSVILYVDVIKAELLPITVTIVVCSIVVLALTAFFIEAMLKGKESQ